MAYEPKLETRGPATTAVVHTTVPAAGIADALGSIYGEVIGYLGRIAVTPIEAFARYTIRDNGATFDIEAGFTTGAPIQPEGRIESGSLPGGQVVTCLHVGPYDQVGAAYEAITGWMGSHELRPAEQPWEIYLSMPDENPPRTLVVFPVQAVAASAGS